jgi:hypothetical protein
MGKVLGTVPNPLHPNEKFFDEYVIEYDGDWWVGSSTVYHSVSGKRAGTLTEHHLHEVVTGAKFKINAGLFNVRTFTWKELLTEYESREISVEDVDDSVAYTFLAILMVVLLGLYLFN